MNSKRILIVDDEPGVTRSLKLNLEAMAGYEVRTENDSALAINAARDFHPQLILLDVLMPRLDGCEVSARIHADRVSDRAGKQRRHRWPRRGCRFDRLPRQAGGHPEN